MGNHPKERVLFPGKTEVQKAFGRPRALWSQPLGRRSSIWPPKAAWLGGMRQCSPSAPESDALHGPVAKKCLHLIPSDRGLPAHRGGSCEVKGSQALGGCGEGFLPSCRCAGKQTSTLSYYCIAVWLHSPVPRRALFVPRILLLPWRPSSVCGAVGHLHFTPRRWS